MRRFASLPALVISLLGSLWACSSTTTIDETGTHPTTGDDGGGSQGTEGGSSSGDDGGGSANQEGGSGGQDSGVVLGPCKFGMSKTGLNAGQQAGGLAFHTYAPANYDPKIQHTIVIIMHGQDSDGTGELSALWQPIADANQLVLLAPKGSRPSTNPGMYPNGANWATADLNSIQDLMPEVDACYNIHPKKHILWGFSEGCFYGYLLGIGASTSFSGLAMGGADTSFARGDGYDPSKVMWKIPVSHVAGTMDPNTTGQILQDQKDFQAQGCTFTLYQPVQGHTITPAQVVAQYNDLKNSLSP